MAKFKYLLSAADIWELIGLLCEVDGLRLQVLHLDDDDDPLPELAADLGISADDIGAEIKKFAGIIRGRLLVFYSENERNDPGVLTDALLQLKVTVPKSALVKKPVGPNHEDNEWWWLLSETAFRRVNQLPLETRLRPFLETASSRNHSTDFERAGPVTAEKPQNLREKLETLREEIRIMYQADNVPWIIGYSGGKDSTAIVQLAWQALADLPKEKRTKPVHVISTDTLVENPVVAQWVKQSLDRMALAAEENRMPFQPKPLQPAVENRYWVNLVGKGYPAPRHKFRWCTERLKISASNEFINSVVRGNGEAILLLGTRKQESQRRERAMRMHERHRVRDRLSPNATLPGTLVYTPIEEWSNDDVWMYLMQDQNPWGYNNKDLLTMYQGASEDGECPLVVDTSTPSCGDSRFGCWVCTLVDKDKSMSAMIQNDQEKEWMYPLLAFRNRYLDFRPPDGSRNEQTDRHRRDFRRMNGSITIYNDRAVHGPYTQHARAELLFELLKAQEAVRKLGREQGIKHAESMELITLHELEEIRRIWVTEKHEIEDTLPSIYERATGRAYPGKELDENLMFGREEMAILQEVCGEDRLRYEMARELLDVERRFRTMSRRAGLFDAIDSAIKRGYFEDEEDATQMALGRQSVRESIKKRLETNGSITPKESAE